MASAKRHKSLSSLTGTAVDLEGANHQVEDKGQPILKRQCERVYEPCRCRLLLLRLKEDTTLNSEALKRKAQIGFG
jgi:hypothetical protein